MERNRIALETALFAIILTLSSPLFAASASATATAGATIVDRISVGAASSDGESSARPGVSIDSTSRLGPLAVSVEVAENDRPARVQTLVADHATLELVDQKRAESGADEKKRKTVLTVVHTY